MTTAARPPKPLPRTRESFNRGWRFFLQPDNVLRGLSWAKAGDFTRCGKAMLPEYEALFKMRSPSMVDYDDAGWRELNLPHDWRIEQPFDPAHHLTAGFLPEGVAWYRKRIDVPLDWRDGRTVLEFDGVYRDAVVFVNGHLATINRSGYVGFSCDVTELLEYGTSNSISIRVDATDKEGWYYEGAGIYRNTWLTRHSSIHLIPEGLAIRTDVDVVKKTAHVAIVVEARNQTDLPFSGRVQVDLLDPAGAVVATSSGTIACDAGRTVETNLQCDLSDIALWSTTRPALYTARATLIDNDATLDIVDQRFGLRTVKFDAERGFLLNGEQLKLKGLCAHQFHSGVGWALTPRLHQWRLEKMKSVGANAFRCAAYAYDPYWYQLCDEEGILVLDELRMTGVSDEALGQMRRVIRRGRNHACIIAWCLGNEEMAIQGTAPGAQIAERMMREARMHDPTRMMTLAMNRAMFDGFAKVVDVQGINYWDSDIYRRNMPGKPVFYSEAASTLGTRGEYVNDEKRCYVTSYDWEPPLKGGAASAETAWKTVASREYVGGTFIWSAFDYLGEQQPYRHWPSVGSHFGLWDSCGFAKDVAHYYRCWWKSEPMIHVFPHWDWPGREGQEIEVWVYCNGVSVELLLNGRSLGSQPVPVNGHVQWNVPYEPGRLTARGTTSSGMVIETRVDTTGPATRIALAPEWDLVRADGTDLVIVNASILDERGRIIPRADHAIEFEIAGPGRFLAVGNGDPTSHESFTVPCRRAFNGLAQLIVGSTDTAGEIRIVARSVGLDEAECVVRSE
jgi:beta-galactosidase